MTAICCLYDNIHNLVIFNFKDWYTGDNNDQFLAAVFYTKTNIPLIFSPHKSSEAAHKGSISFKYCYRLKIAYICIDFLMPSLLWPHQWELKKFHIMFKLSSFLKNGQWFFVTQVPTYPRILPRRDIKSLSANSIESGHTAWMFKLAWLYLWQRLIT